LGWEGVKQDIGWGIEGPQAQERDNGAQRGKKKKVEAWKAAGLFKKHGKKLAEGIGELAFCSGPHFSRDWGMGRAAGGKKEKKIENRGGGGAKGKGGGVVKGNAKIS